MMARIKIPATKDVLDVTREIDENTPAGTGIGNPISATDADNDLLVYSMEDGNLYGRYDPPVHVDDDDG